MRSVGRRTVYGIYVEGRGNLTVPVFVAWRDFPEVGLSIFKLGKPWVN
jgi:hypothetical protein